MKMVIFWSQFVILGVNAAENVGILFIMTCFWKWCGDIDHDGDAIDNDVGDVVYDEKNEAKALYDDKNQNCVEPAFGCSNWWCGCFMMVLMIEMNMTMVIPFIACPTALSRPCHTGMVQMILCTLPEALCQRLALSSISDIFFKFWWVACCCVQCPNH